MIQPTHILGVDPGLGGGLCLLRIQTKAIDAIFDMPLTPDNHVDPAALAGIVDLCKLHSTRLHAAVELVSSMPRQAGAFNFGVSAGIVHGVLGALSVPMTLVQPAQWKSSCGLRKTVGESQSENKSRARELAMKLWPEHAAEFKRVKDADRAEAALIARAFVNLKGW